MSAIRGLLKIRSAPAENSSAPERCRENLVSCNFFERDAILLRVARLNSRIIEVEEKRNKSASR